MMTTLRALLASGASRTGIASRAVLAVSAAALLVAWLRPVDPSVAPETSQRRPPDLARLAAGDSGEALRHPIFDSGRRSWTAGGSLGDVSGEARPTTTLVLRGVLVDGRGKRALVDDGLPGAAWLGEQEGRGTWKIVVIEPGRVEVADGPNRYTLDFLGAPIRLRPATRLQPPPSTFSGDLRKAM